MDVRRTELQRIGHDIEEYAVEIVNSWHEIADEEPWFHMPNDLSLDHLPELIQALAPTAYSHSTPAHREKLLWTAATHGQRRGEEGFSDDLVLREHLVLRQALWRFINQRHGASEAKSEAMVRIGLALSLATLASMRGYHLRYFEKRGEWPAAIHRIAEAAPELPSLPPEPW